jgi:hypothetical protein
MNVVDKILLNSADETNWQRDAIIRQCQVYKITFQNGKFKKKEMSLDFT